MAKHCTIPVDPPVAADPSTAPEAAPLHDPALPTSNSRRWHIQSDPAILRQVRVELEQFAAQVGADDDARHAIGLCANEALANVIRHGYRGRHDRPVEVVAEHIDGQIRLLIRDWAPPIDPAKLPTGPKDPLKPGGLGLLCMRKMMDDVQFRPQPDGNFLTMAKTIKKP